MNVEVKKPIIVWDDNNIGAIFMSGNSSSPVPLGQYMNIDTRWHFVQELVEDKFVEVVFVKSQDKMA